jgi:hypothetical protein
MAGFTRLAASPAPTGVTPYLQNRGKLSETVAHLGIRQLVCPLRSGCVGSCCGQVWWSAQVGCPGNGMFRRADMHYECTAEEC